MVKNFFGDYCQVSKDTFVYVYQMHILTLMAACTWTSCIYFVEEIVFYDVPINAENRLWKEDLGEKLYFQKMHYLGNTWNAKSENPCFGLQLIENSLRKI